MGMIINPYRFISGDANATAFLTAAGITDATITSAINTLVTDLKGYGLWTKCSAIYPFVGGTADTHKFNLKDPRDDDAAFRLTFGVGISHSSNGMDGSGASTAYCDTKMATMPNGWSDIHLSFYSRQDINGDNWDCGAGSSFRFWSRLANVAYFDNGTRYSVANTNSTGLFIVNTTASNNSMIIRNGVSLGAGNASSSTFTESLKIYMYTVGSGVGSRECAFFSVGTGFTQTQYENFYTAVQKFQTTLGRQV